MQHTTDELCFFASRDIGDSCLLETVSLFLESSAKSCFGLPSLGFSTAISPLFLSRTVASALTGELQRCVLCHAQVVQSKKNENPRFEKSNPGAFSVRAFPPLLSTGRTFQA
jgi:hypothetical protein